MTIGYDNASRRTTVTYPNTNSLLYGYNDANDLTSLTYKQGATTVGDLTYTYDAAGRRTTIGGTFARASLPPALTTATYNANNQQKVFGTNTLNYDLNGNLNTVTDPGGTSTYTWNVRNQLTGLSATGFAATFSYDSFGRRTGKTVQGVTTNFVYDGLNPVQEKNGATVTANLLTGLGIDEFFTRTDGVGVRALLPDALGSTVALGDGTGTLQTQYTYEPFGFASQTGVASTNSYKYTGREEDGTGLVYYRARYYHPRLQRFISEDPIGFAGGDTNLYGYVRNGPVALGDPLGLQAIPAPIPGVPIPFPLPPIAIPGSPQNQQAAQATGEGYRKLQEAISNLIFSKSKQGSRPKDCPPGTKPIDQIPGLSKDDRHRIKDAVGAGPQDWTGIAPNKDVITGDSNGDAVNHGPLDTFLP